MQEKKNKRLFIILVVLASSTAGAYWLTRGGENNAVNKNIFRDYDLKAIDEVLLESASGKISLKFSGARWKVNDQYYANPDMIEVLFATLQQAEPKRPLASSLQDSVARGLQARGVKVSLLSQENLKSSFYTGGNATKTQTFFMDVKENKPYLMTIPGYRVYVSGIFELGESGWRDKFVFGFNWRNFQSLEVTFPNKPSDDFVVAMQNNYFSVQGLSKVDTTRLNDYLDDISLLTVDEYVAPTSSLDSLATVPALLKISVKDIGRKEYVLQVYPPLSNTGKFPGLINGSQWALFEKTRVSGLIRPRHFFEN
ncbi:MAG: hypothetical protein C0490_09470 [Marivirga sp.]|nr:hypothetical protein [Marivirga sp.]